MHLLHCLYQTVIKGYDNWVPILLEFPFFNFPLFSVQNKRIYIINFFPKIDYFVIITTVFFSNKTNNLLIRVCLVNWVGIYGTYIYKVEGWSTIYPSNICLIILNVIILAISHIFLRGKLKYFRFQIWFFLLFLCMQSSSAKGDQNRPKNGHDHPAFFKEKVFIKSILLQL